MIIEEKDPEKAKRIIKECKERPIVVRARDENFNRRILEYGRFDILLDVEGYDKKESLRQNDSGFNHVHAEIASKNHIYLGIDLEKINKMEKKEKAILLSKIKQNIKICKKAGCKLKVINFRDEKDAFALLSSIGADSRQSKEAVKSISF